MTPLARIVEIASPRQKLSKARGFLVIESNDVEVGRIPLDDVSSVIITSPDATVTTKALAALAERGIPVVLSGTSFQPSAIVWPLAGHHAQGERIRAQLEQTRPLAKQLWAQIVKAKIANQACALRTFGIEAGAFNLLARQVRSGDPANIEAQAARRYWRLLMGKEFHREQEGVAANAMLNYGYAIIRSAVARAICAAGLYPGLGVFHRNRGNSMPLADDMMEPFRPAVDMAVRRLNSAGATDVAPEVKRQLVEILWFDLKSPLGTTPLSTSIHRAVGSLVESYMVRKPVLQFPMLTEWFDERGIERLPDHVDGADV